MSIVILPRCAGMALGTQASCLCWPVGILPAGDSTILQAGRPQASTAGTAVFQSIPTETHPV